MENEEKLRLEREENEKLRSHNDKNKNDIPDMKDLGNISGIDAGMDGGDNIQGDFGDENMGD